MLGRLGVSAEKNREPVILHLASPPKLLFYTTAMATLAQLEAAEKKAREIEALTIRMPLVSAKRTDHAGNRISPYDILFLQPHWAAHHVALPHPIPKLYNGIDGIVIINATFNGMGYEHAPVKCAIRMQGLNGNIANDREDPMVLRGRDYPPYIAGETPAAYKARETTLWEAEYKAQWDYFINGLKRGMVWKFGPQLYDVFCIAGGLVRDDNKSNRMEGVLKQINIGVDAVELMKDTLFDYGHTQKGAMDYGDFMQFVVLFIRMREAYKDVYPAFPKDLHANNCMYKLVDGKRVWLFTDIDEHPDYMVPNKDSPVEMAKKTLNFRPDIIPPPKELETLLKALHKPVSPPKTTKAAAKAAAKPKTPPRVPSAASLARQAAELEARYAAAAKRAAKPKTPPKAKTPPRVPTFASLSRQAEELEARQLALLRRPVAGAAKPAAAAPRAPPIINPSMLGVQGGGITKKKTPPKKTAMGTGRATLAPRKTAAIPKRTAYSPKKATSPKKMSDARVLGSPMAISRKKSIPKRSPKNIKPYDPMMTDYPVTLM